MNATLEVLVAAPGSVCTVKGCPCGLPKPPAVSMPGAACFTGCGCDSGARR